ncbi:hypothetical protein EDC96DRAFT_515348 [Choanephora cucurbitarum]|nr:hypothetical protein EDC96DRAFT_515348 [Choanephora cucurbitarum]
MSQPRFTEELNTIEARRTARSASPVVEDIESSASSSTEESSAAAFSSSTSNTIITGHMIGSTNNNNNNNNTLTTTTTTTTIPAAAAAAALANTTTTGSGGRVTRSQSVESSGYETTDSRKRKRQAKATTAPNKRKADTKLPSSPPLQSNIKDDTERETRTSSQRLTKEAREAKKAQRDFVIKERLEELDKLEQAVKDGSHIEYHKLLSNIEEKRAKMLNVAEMRRSLAESIVINFFNWQKEAAYSQYHWDKLALRRSMIQHVQHRINVLEQEYYSNHVQSSLDDEHLTEWVPPDRPSMISSLTLGLSEEDADHDIEWAKQDPNEEKSNTATPPSQIPSQTNHYRESSPPLDMLASLADGHTYPQSKEFKEEPSEKTYKLPPLNSWHYSRNNNERPSLPT